MSDPFARPEEAMAAYSQADRPLKIDTPLGDDAVLIEKLHGTEAVSELYRFQLTLLAEKAVPFEKLLGQAVGIEMARARRQAAIRARHGDEVHPGRRRSWSAREADAASLRGGSCAAGLVADAQSAEPHFSAPRRAGHPQDPVRGAGRSLSTRRQLSRAQLLRAVSGIGLRLRQPPHGRRGHLLLFRISQGWAYAGGGGFGTASEADRHRRPRRGDLQ